MLATLVAPTSGDVRYGGRPARARGAQLRRRIGLLAHELHLYPELSARQNLDVLRELYGLDAARHGRRGARIGRASRDRGDDEVSAASRAACASASRSSARCCTGPRLVLLDEPFTGLDDRAVSIVADRLRRLAAGGAIVVLATHDLDVADGLVHARGAGPRRPARCRTSRAAPGLRARYRALVGSA